MLRRRSTPGEGRACSAIGIVGAAPLLDKRSRLFRTASRDRLELFSVLPVVVLEELLDLVEQAGPEVAERLHVLMRPGVRRNGQKAIVALGLAVFGLFGFDD